MKRQHITFVVFAATLVVVGVMVAAQSQDRFTLKSANGIAFSEFRDYEAWQMIATSQPDDAGGCGTSKVGCTKAILGNATMIKRIAMAFRRTAAPSPTALRWPRSNG